MYFKQVFTMELFVFGAAGSAFGDKKLYRR
jgi:hypothetical protein